MAADMPSGSARSKMRARREWRLFLRVARRRLRECDDSGAALILALIFIIVAGLSFAALATFAGTSLLNTANLISTRGAQYASESALDIAIQHVRYSGTSYETPTLLNGTPLTTPESCLAQKYVSIAETGHPTRSTAHMYSVAVTCTGSASNPYPVFGPTGGGTISSGSEIVHTSTLFGTGAPSRVGYVISDTSTGLQTTTVIVAQPGNGFADVSKPATVTRSGETFTLEPTFERLVTFYACKFTPATSGTPTCGPTHFAVRATVAFNDVSQTGTWACGVAPTPSSPTSTCGSSMSIRQWQVRAANT